jgi:23S rRNA (adenine2503-C2)-methyltransferase
MDFAELSEFITSESLPAYRLKQIKKNYFSGRYGNFMEMSDLPLSLRTLLDQKFSLFSVVPSTCLVGEFSQKALLQLDDGLKIETVLMDYENWLTACVSTQVGCPLACSFCATGKMGLKRNLTSSEIVDQVLFWNHRLFPKYIGRIVFMGMGEPFLNWDNLLEAIDIIRNDLQIGARKISISTAGIVPRIYDFANLDTEVNLAVSLHSADQSTREQMMPIARQYSLDELLKSLLYYVDKTHRQVFFEYLLAKNVNDSDRHLNLLIDFIRSSKLFYLNLIPLNPIKNGLTPSTRLDYFQSKLAQAGINFSVRQSIGRSINSACGQLIVDK